MKKINCFLFLALFILACSPSTSTTKVGSVSIIPLPAQQLIGNGFFDLKKEANIDVEEEAQAKIVQMLFPSFNTTIDGKSNAIKMTALSSVKITRKKVH